MNSVVESKRTRGTALVAGTNVVLLAILVALFLVTVFGLTARPTSAGHGYITNSSTVGNPPVLRWTGLPSGFEDGVQSAVASWDGLGIVNWVRNDTVGQYTLRYTTSGDAYGPYQLGQYTPIQYGADAITFYPTNVNRLGYGTADRRWLVRHESGHAISLKHPYEMLVLPGGEVYNGEQLRSNANQLCCVMHTFHVAGVGVTNLTTHDRNHYNGYWGMYSGG